MSTLGLALARLSFFWATPPEITGALLTPVWIWPGVRPELAEGADGLGGL
jgi:hypothetical protein